MRTAARLLFLCFALSLVPDRAHAQTFSCNIMTPTCDSQFAALERGNINLRTIRSQFLQWSNMQFPLQVAAFDITLTSCSLVRGRIVTNGGAERGRNPVPNGPGDPVVVIASGEELELRTEAANPEIIGFLPQTNTCFVGPGDPCGEVVGGLRNLDGSCDPILLDFGRLGFDLTSAEDGVRFDVDGDGSKDDVSWTQGASRDAFLVLDRNGNGVIDDGGELFGNATRLSDGTFARDGYVAMAELDRADMGGNGNGHLDRADRAYKDLRLWTDHNHDGVSDSVELTSLESRGVVSIRTTAATSPWTDEHGNRFALVSLAYVKGPRGVRPILTTDVFFVVKDPAPAP